MPKNLKVVFATLFLLALISYGPERIIKDVKSMIPKKQNINFETVPKQDDNILCHYDKLDQNNLRNIRIGELFPKDSVTIGVPAYFVDLDNDGRKDLILFSRGENFNIIMDYYSVLDEIKPLRKLFKERMKRQFVSLKYHLPIDKIQVLPSSYTNIKFRDIDNDKKIEIIYDGDDWLRVLKWNGKEFRSIFEISSRISGGRFPEKTEGTLIYDFDSDGFFEIFFKSNKLYKPFGLYRERPLISCLNFYDMKNRKHHTIEYAPKNESLGTYEDSSPDGDIAYVFDLDRRIWNSPRLTQKQKTDNHNLLRRVTEYKII